MKSSRAPKSALRRLGHQVIYGDTDSLFVLLGAGVKEDEARERGRELAG